MVGPPRDTRVCFQVRSQGLLPVQRSGSTSSSEISVQLWAHSIHFPTEKVRQEWGRKCRDDFLTSVSKKKKKRFSSSLLSLQSKKKKRINNTGTPQQASQLSALCCEEEVTAEVDKGCHVPRHTHTHGAPPRTHPWKASQEQNP